MCIRDSFTAFAALRGNEPRPIPEGYFRRTITQTQVAQTGEQVFITFTGTGDVYKRQATAMAVRLSYRQGSRPPCTFSNPVVSLR